MYIDNIENFILLKSPFLIFEKPKQFGMKIKEIFLDYKFYSVAEKFWKRPKE
jgi:hypothetical protein